MESRASRVPFSGSIGEGNMFPKRLKSPTSFRPETVPNAPKVGTGRSQWSNDPVYDTARHVTLAYLAIWKQFVAAVWQRKKFGVIYCHILPLHVIE